MHEKSENALKLREKRDKKWCKPSKSHLLQQINVLISFKNNNDTQIINSAARILECVVPLLKSPSENFLFSLETSLCKLIFQGGMLVRFTLSNKIQLLLTLKTFFSNERSLVVVLAALAPSLINSPRTTSSPLIAF